MRTSLWVFAACVLSCPGADITFSNRVVTFTNLEGKVYPRVELVHGDMDGLIWRSDSSAGRVCYTNLDPAFLEELGVPSNRIEIARARAEHRAAVDARERGRAQAVLNARKADQEKWAAGAPARDREAQRQADLAKINALKAQIEGAQTEVDVADAVTPVGASGDAGYVDAVMAQRQRVNLAQIRVNNARKQLDALITDYEQKHGQKEQ